MNQPMMIDVWDRFSTKDKEIMAKCIPSKNVAVVALLSVERVFRYLGRISDAEVPGTFSLYSRIEKEFKLPMDLHL